MMPLATTAPSARGTRAETCTSAVCPRIALNDRLALTRAPLIRP